MRKLVFLLTFLLFVGFQASAQMQITGKVTNAESGDPIPGASVVVKSQTSIGTTTNMDGNYELDGVPSDAETLVFSFVGMEEKEVPINGKTTIDAELAPSVQEMEEVVVTAMGISRDKKSLGYATQDIGSESLGNSNQTDVMTSLSGKIAGVSVSSSSGSFGGSSKVLLRGVGSIDGNNNPLYVVDGVPVNNENFNSYNTERGGGGYDWGNAGMDINSSDIEDISVLKGASATALYGSRAANGVIMITTKSGKAQKGIGVDWSSNVTFSEVGKLPQYQNKYGGGQGPFGEVEVDGETYQTVNYAMDQSWGPPLEGQEVVHWNNVYDWEQGITDELQTRPWEANEGNVRNFFETGVSFKNNVAFSGGNENNTFRLSYTNIDRKGIYPNSEMDRNNIQFKGSTNLTDNLEVHADVKYSNYYNKARPQTGYGDFSLMQKFTQWGQRQWDMDIMSNYMNPDGTQRTWNRTSFSNPDPKYADNFYFIQNEVYPEQWRERVNGKVGFSYEFMEGLKLTANAKKDYYVDTREQRIPEESLVTSSFSRSIREITEDNYEARLNYNTELTDDFTFDGMIGVNRYNYDYEYNYAATQGGLSVPGIYAIDNAKSNPTTSDRQSDKRINSVFGRVGLDYMDTYYLDMTVRNDWSSSLPEGERSYLYPSFTGSVILSEMAFAEGMDWLSFAKLRGSWAQVGSDTDPYQTSLTYAAYDSFRGEPRTSLPNTLANPGLKPERTQSVEGGFNIAVFDNRISLDFTYYDKSSFDQIITLPISASSGYSSMVANAGEITNQGTEVMLNLTPLKGDDYSWNIGVNWSENTNEVVELSEGISNYQLGQGPFNATVAAAEGETYGVIRGSDYVTDDDGNKITEGGMYVESDEPEVLGSYLPDWTGGLTNSLKYKGFDLSFTIDVRKGGSLFSTTNMWGQYSGMLEETAENNIREYGVVLEGVKPDGTPNDVAISAQEKGLNHYSLAAMNMIETDYYKLRDVSLSYTLPPSLIENLPVEGLTLGITGRNLLVWGTKSKHFDPEHTTTSGNIGGIEGGGLPPTKAYGFKLDVKF